MPQFYKLIVLIFLIAGCNQHVQEKSAKDEDTLHKNTDTLTKKNTITNDSSSLIKNDSTLLKLSAEILNSLKAKDFKQLAAFIKPSSGIRFSPYGFIDTAHDKILSAKQLNDFVQNDRPVNWGRYDGTGEPINLSLNKYFQKFVYDEDFLNAKNKSVNKMSGSASSLERLQSTYPGCDFTEFYFPGFNPKYDGMDWKALRLVFKRENDTYYLVAIVHDQWTS